MIRLINIPSALYTYFKHLDKHEATQKLWNKKIMPAHRITKMHSRI